MWEKSIKRVNRFVENFLCVLIVTMVVLIFLQIASRVVFNSSFAWTDELARFLMIWLTFLGASVAFQHGAHISIEYFLRKLKHQYSKWIQLFSSLAVIVFCTILFIKGFEIIDKASVQKSSALQIPMGIIYYIMPISAVLIILNVIDIAIKSFRVNSDEVEKLERNEI